MDILVRNIEVDVVRRLDVKAKKNGYRSRNEYIVRLLEGDSIKELVSEVENKYSNLVMAITNVVSENTERLERFEKEFGKQLTDIEMDVRELQKKERGV